MKKRYFLISIVCCCLGWGCSQNHWLHDPFWRNYTNETEGLDISKSPYFEIIKGETKVIKSSYENVTADEIKMLEDRYIRIGYSSFNDQPHHESGAILLAKKFMLP